MSPLANHNRLVCGNGDLRVEIRRKPLDGRQNCLGGRTSLGQNSRAGIRLAEPDQRGEAILGFHIYEVDRFAVDILGDNNSSESRMLFIRLIFSTGHRKKGALR